MSKIKLKVIYRHGKGHALKWRDIKHLELKDDDVIHAAWLMMIILIIKDNGQIQSMVEESDEQYEKRIQRAKISVAELKKTHENYLKLKRI
jgi:hypothetical protein